MPEKQSKEITLKIIVGGQLTEVKVDENELLKTVIPKALEQTKNTGQPPSNWELKDANGNSLDIDKKIETFDFTSETVLYLSLKAGAGGTINRPANLQD